jgi:hypothetical protein
MRGVVAILYGWAVQKIVDFTSVVNDEPLQIAICAQTLLWNPQECRFFCTAIQAANRDVTRLTK